jgi:hypothetical protein
VSPAVQSRARSNFGKHSVAPRLTVRPKQLIFMQFVTRHTPLQVTAERSHHLDRTQELRRFWTQVAIIRARYSAALGELRKLTETLNEEKQFLV